MLETERRWLRQRPKFRANYAEARERQADWLAAQASASEVGATLGFRAAPAIDPPTT